MKLHVTHIRNGEDVWGHLEQHCDQGGCALSADCYYSGIDADETCQGDLIELWKVVDAFNGATIAGEMMSYGRAQQALDDHHRQWLEDNKHNAHLIYKAAIVCFSADWTYDPSRQEWRWM
jgi:hypothetical protein